MLHATHRINDPHQRTYGHKHVTPHLGNTTQKESNQNQATPVNHLVLRVKTVYDRVFQDSTQTQLRGIGSTRSVRIPKSYTSLSEKLPNISSTALWSETVIRSMFDTLIPLSPEYSYTQGSPGDSIVIALQKERKTGKREIPFGLLLAELIALEELLPELDILDGHREQILKTIARIREIK